MNFEQIGSLLTIIGGLLVTVETIRRLNVQRTKDVADASGAILDTSMQFWTRLKTELIEVQDRLSDEHEARTALSAALDQETAKRRRVAVALEEETAERRQLAEKVEAQSRVIVKQHSRINRLLMGIKELIKQIEEMNAIPRFKPAKEDLETGGDTGPLKLEPKL